jgi:hypothetical protein
MFWMFLGLGSLMMFAATLGQYSVWFAMLKLALAVALLVIVMMGIALIYRRFKGSRQRAN